LIVGYAGKYKDLVTETVAKEIYNRKSTPHDVFELHIDLNKGIIRLTPATFCAIFRASGKGMS